MRRITGLFAAALTLAASSGWALSLGNNITIYDGTGYKESGQGGEDGEVEPGMARKQVWDLEAFVLDGNVLSLIGGFNFDKGVQGYDGQGGNPDFTSGDIFIDTDGTYGSTAEPSYQPRNGQETINATFGYEYALALDFDSKTYDLYALGEDTKVVTAYYKANEEDTPGSNPWRYASGGETLGADLGFEFIENPLDGSAFVGENHYAMTGFDLSFLGAGTTFTSHFTMGCGNDNLMGRGTLAPVPEPATLLLLGTGLTGVAGVARRRGRGRT